MKTTAAQSLHRQKLNHDKLTKDRAFDVNDKVFVNNPQGTPTWLEGIVALLELLLSNPQSCVDQLM